MPSEAVDGWGDESIEVCGWCGHPLNRLGECVNRCEDEMAYWAGEEEDDG